jgi:hypothetical protein
MQTDTMPALGYGAEATYDPADDKLRLRTVSRLCAEDYQRAKAAGFAWAPKQGCFFASWTPERADLLEEWCGEIQDEGSTLEERAAERAERFEGYSERREADGDAAHARVAAITDGIPLGQPILVGHHSERHARRDAKRIENGMRRAVKMWETAEYWQRRARAAVANAERKELPGVRTRRIAKLAADLRGFERDRDERRYFRELWEKLSRGETILRHKSTGELATLPECARYIALAESSGVPHRAAVKDPALDDTAVRAVAASAAEHYRTLEAERQRWVDHTEHRIAYEREALGLEGADASAPLLYKAGGSVEYCGIRRTIERVANRGGATVSLRLRGYRASIPVDAVRDYQAPDADAAALPKPPPILNYRLAEGETLAVQNPCREEHWVARQISMTTEEYGKIPNDYKATRLVADGSHRVRSAMRGGSLALVHLTDGPQHARPEHARPVTN